MSPGALGLWFPLDSLPPCTRVASVQVPRAVTFVQVPPAPGPRVHRALLSLCHLPRCCGVVMSVCASKKTCVQARVCTNTCASACRRTAVCAHVCANVCASPCFGVHAAERVCAQSTSPFYSILFFNLFFLSARVNLHVHPCMCLCVCVHIRVSTWMRIRVSKHPRVHASVAMCTPVCVCVCACVFSWRLAGQVYSPSVFFLWHYRVLDDITQILKQHVPAGPSRQRAASGSALPRLKPAAAPGHPRAAGAVLGGEHQGRERWHAPGDAQPG